MMEGVSISFGDRKEVEDDSKPENEEDVIRHIARLEQENPNRQITFNGYPANVRRFEKSSKEQAVLLFLKQQWQHFKEVFQKKLITTIEKGLQNSTN